MKLDRFGTRLDDYLEGTLGADERRDIDALLAASPEARRELEDYRRLIGELGDLPESIEPRRDLFPAIESRIDRIAATEPLRRRLALAAVLVASIGVAFLSWRDTPREAGQALGTPEPVAAVPAAASARPAELTATSRAEDDLVAASEQLRLALEANRAALPPETRLLVERNLEIIQSAIAEIQLALDHDPGNQELQRALVAYYQHELGLLEQVNRAASRL